MKIQDFVNKGITVKNDMGEIRKTSESSIVFPNGWVGNILKKDDGYSVAVCDYNGYFDWNILKPFSNNDGIVFCQNEKDVCNALSFIEAFK
jgi:hypothetical protein